MQRSRFAQVIRPHTLAAGLAAAVALLACALLWPLLGTAERAFYDRLQGRSHSSSAPRLIVLKAPGMSAADLARLLPRLVAASPQAIVFAHPLPSAEPGPGSATQPHEPAHPNIAADLANAIRDWDATLAARRDDPAIAALWSKWQALGLVDRLPELQSLQRRAGAGITTAKDLAALLPGQRVVLAEPAIVAGIWAWGVDQPQTDGDGVLRHEFLPAADDSLPSLAWVAAAALLAEPGRSAAEVLPALYARIHPDRDGRWFPRFVVAQGDDRAVDTVAAAALLAGRVSEDVLRGRLVVLDLSAERALRQLPGLGHLGHGVALAQRIAAIADSAAVRLPALAMPAAGGTALLAVLGALTLSARGRPRHAGMLLAATALGLVLCSAFLLRMAGLWVPSLTIAAWLVLSAASSQVLERLGLPPNPGNGRPTRLGRYRVESDLGRGALGVVYLGFDPRIGRRVALKTLDLAPQVAEEDRAAIKRRFFSEAASAGRLSHPGIVQIYDADEHRGVAYIAMELIEGHDLSRHTYRYALLPVAEVLGYLAEAAEALDYAHRQGVVHRDVKPANLLKEEASGRIKLTDFGIAGAAEESAAAGAASTLGSPAYMSPEQLAGRPLDGRSDLFSLGVSAYQLLTGQLPFRADHLEQLMQRISAEEAAAPSAIRRDLLPAIDAVITRLMHKQPARRYADGAAAAADLRRAAAAAA